MHRTMHIISDIHRTCDFLLKGFVMGLVQLDGKGSFSACDSEHGLVVTVGDRKFVTRFDSNDFPYIGVDGKKVLVTWF